MEEKIYLGRHKTNGVTYLTKHKWDCGWYWAFGYVGNSRCHWHISAIIQHSETSVNHHFESTWITQDQWWILRDLFLSAYTLKKAAETYRHGGFQTRSAKPYLTFISEEMEKRINEDLGKLLDTIWELVSKWQEESRSKWKSNCVGGQCRIV
jgi:hypothetical protein